MGSADPSEPPPCLPLLQTRWMPRPAPAWGLILPGFAAASSDPPSAGRGLCAGADEDGNPGQRVLERTVFFVWRHFGELQRASVLAERFQEASSKLTLWSVKLKVSLKKNNNANAEVMQSLSVLLVV
uniref:Uncharacterized protein n=1 Tax=Anser brachyrhynchus TaxID=132585 RepID=A0A8B9BF42_9AVES